MGGGRRYDKQGSAYPIRINSEAIHSKDRGRGRAGERGGQGKGGERKGERKEGGEKGKLYKK